MVDAHSDIMVDVMFRRSRGGSGILKDIHIPKLQKGGVDVMVTPVAWDEPQLNCYRLRCLLQNIKYLESEVDESSGKIMIATTVEEIQKGLSKGKIAMLLGLEGGMVIEYDLDILKLLYKLKVRCIGLTWNKRNQIADGSAERTNCGLSNFGIELIREMNKLGVLIDVSHISEQSFWDVLEATKDPVIASHSNARSVHDHIRNLSDEQIKAIAEKGGVVGIAFYPGFVGNGNLTITDVLRHIDYVIDLVGADHVGLGPDFIDYMTDYVIQALSKEPKVYPKPTYVYPTGIEDVTKMPNITKELSDSGYSIKEIEKILGGNFLRVFKTVIG